MKKVSIYIDGASKGNPGPAGIGVVVCDEKGKTVKNISKYIGQTTNNIAEYTALIWALQEALIMKIDHIQINTDSELLARQLGKTYKVKDENLKVLYEQVNHLLGGFSKVEVKRIDRADNKGADKLATQAIGTIKVEKKPESFIIVDKQPDLFEN